jgi:DNA-directed RNA polymerase specialized sigma24 family protein
MKREREPTQKELDKLLAWLDLDREAGAAKYETIRNGLIRFFLFRECIDSEMLADEVINRVAVRIDKVVEKYSEPAKCFKGFAGNVYLEYLQDPARQVGTDASVLPDPPDDEEERKRLELEDECLKRCMGKLSTADDDLFRRYFQDLTPAKIKIRKKLAAELRLTSNALSIKVARIRKRLRECMKECLAEASNQMTDIGG